MYFVQPSFCFFEWCAAESKFFLGASSNRRSFKDEIFACIRAKYWGVPSSSTGPDNGTQKDEIAVVIQFSYFSDKNAMQQTYQETDRCPASNTKGAINFQKKNRYSAL